jgi:hypothetical protein
MRTVAIWTSVATVAVLNVVIGLGLFGWGDRAVCEQALVVFHVVLPVSSCLMLALFVRSRRWGAAGLAAAIVAGMLIVGTLGLAEVSFSRGLHLVIDLAALNAYIIATQLLLRNGSAHTE